MKHSVHSFVHAVAMAALCAALTVATVGCTSAPMLPDESIERFEMQPDVAFLPSNYTIAQLCEESELVVVGRVTDHRNVAYPGEKISDRCMGHATVKIEEVLLGETAKRTIDVQDCFYIDEESGTEVTAWGAPLMRKGHRVLLFLKTDPDPIDKDKEPPYVVIHGELGKFFADEQGLFYPAVSLSASSKDGDPHLSLEHMEPRRLEDIRREIPGA